VATPTFNGSACFGKAVSMATGSGQPSVQVTGYPSVSGVELLVMGGRGRYTQVSGILTAATPELLAVAEATLRNFRESSLVAALVTTQGETFPYAVVWDYKPAPRVVGPTSNGEFERSYQALIFHLL
jgi:hypothetical protein